MSNGDVTIDAQAEAIGRALDLFVERVAAGNFDEGVRWARVVYVLARADGGRRVILRRASEISPGSRRVATDGNQQQEPGD
jgi:hypothetical protein